MCSGFTIPAAFTTTELLKAKYCGSVVSLDSGCAYLSSASTTACSAAPNDCTGISFPASVSSN